MRRIFSCSRLIRILKKVVKLTCFDITAWCLSL